MYFVGKGKRNLPVFPEHVHTDLWSAVIVFVPSLVLDESGKKERCLCKITFLSGYLPFLSE